MNDYISYLQQSTIIHYGVKGQHWGERRWQNQDGSLTEAGRIHYGYGEERKNGKYASAKKDMMDIADNQFLSQMNRNEKHMDSLISKYAKRDRELTTKESRRLLGEAANIKINEHDFEAVKKLVNVLSDDEFNNIRTQAKKEHAKDVKKAVLSFAGKVGITALDLATILYVGPNLKFAIPILLMSLPAQIKLTSNIISAKGTDKYFLDIFNKKYGKYTYMTDNELESKSYDLYNEALDKIKNKRVQ